MEEEIEKLAPVRRGIYILPNLFTTASLFAGFYAIVAGMNHLFFAAAMAILIALVCDGLDGRVARLINAQSAFGAEYDSLSDLVSFGLAPALVAYTWTLSHLGVYGLGKVGWLTAFIYVACVALRLARFNTRIDDGSSKRYFYGLPCPAAAALIACLIWVGNDYAWSGLSLTIVTAVIMWVLSLFMVSNIKFRSFKDIDLKDNVRFTYMVILVLLIVLIALRPGLILLSMLSLYVLSGFFCGLWKLKRKKPGTPG